MLISDWPISNRIKSVLNKVGYYKLEDLPIYLDDLKEIDGLGIAAIREIREWCNSKFGHKFKTRPKVKKKVLKDYTSSRQVLEHLIPGPKNWPKQLKIADQLIEKYGAELLLKVKPNEKVYSLVWFLSSWGDAYIRKFMTGVVIQEPVIVEEEVEPCEFNITTTKPKTLKDFLKI